MSHASGLADRQQERGILDSVQGMPGGRHHEEITRTAFP
jgi:hypothetical protein